MLKVNAKVLGQKQNNVTKLACLYLDVGPRVANLKKNWVQPKLTIVIVHYILLLKSYF